MSGSHARASTAPGGTRRLTVRLWRIAGAILAGAGVVVLPFLALVRGAVAFHGRGYPTWVAMTAAAALAILILGGYAAVVSLAVTGRLHARFALTRVALPLVLLYAAYALFSVSRANVKSEEIRGYYRALHPILRTAVATVILADRDLVITDLARTPAAYPRMGLREPGTSLHYRQRDGYVHAADVRTLGRTRVRNMVLEGAFRVMGFRTRRHSGTADHLHVELPAR